MAQLDKFRHDNTKMPIIAFDFDGTLTRGDTYPAIQPLRPLTKEIIDFIRACGMKVVIWTTRDKDDNGHDDITPMVEFLKQNNIEVDNINHVIDFSPWVYESRKIYAHMYVDDKAYGWVDSALCLMYVLGDILIRFCGCNDVDVSNITGRIVRGEDASGYARAIKNRLELTWV